MTQDTYISDMANKITEATYKTTDPKDYTPWQKAMEAKSKESTHQYLPHSVKSAYEDEKKDPEFQKYITDLQAKLFPKH